MARFFINRPIFAWVLAIIVMLAGLLSILTLPVAQYPAIAPPQISINVVYPGASAQTVQDTVTQVIEQKLNGIDNLIYMASNSDSAGYATITLTFKAGTDPDIAQVQVQNKLQLAEPMLPEAVKRQGISVTKSTRNFLLIIGLISEDGSMSRFDLADYAVANIQDIVSRLPGVGEVQMFGSQNAMRIWLDPDRLYSYGLTSNDVIAALQAQNAQVSGGQFGGNPATAGQQLNATITARSLLQTPEQFNEILLRTSASGASVRLKDVARCEVGTENYDIQARYKGMPVAGLGIRLASDANALDTATVIKNKMEELSAYFPPGMSFVFPYDTTPFVKLSIQGVVRTLIEAVLLVFVIMFLFLQNIRATLIPTIAVPVVLLGTFGILAATGFSINTLTMFAMVLAIGLLIDDAIVVVENVERLMTEEGLPPKEATIKSMEQITSALWGIALVLVAVFIPMAFFGGSTGVIYRQFSITMVSAMLLSVLVALILTPALCATMLKPVHKGHIAAEGSWFKGFFRGFNRAFDYSSGLYQSIVGWSVRRTGRFLLLFALICSLLGYLFVRMPTAFLPEEDQGYILCQLQLPAGATANRTFEVIQQIERHFLENEAEVIESVLTVSGFSFAGRGQNMGLAFVKLKDWHLRHRPDQRVAAVAGRAMRAFSQIKDALVFAFVPPAVMELGTANGFDFQLQDRAGLGHNSLMAARNQLLGMAAKNPVLMAVRPNGQDDTPEFRLLLDDERAGALGLQPAAINEVISSVWGSAYVNDFIENGRVKKVYLQAGAPFRMQPQDIDRWYVRNASGAMVPFSAFTTATWSYASPRLERYNGLPSRQILGQAAPGYSTGDAMAEMEKLASQLPAGIGFEWTGLSYEERLGGAQAPIAYAISLLVVFLCLAALYESWAVPFSVMLVVPLGVIGAVTAATLRGFSNDIYFQIAILTTIGLSARNAIMIVEFAKELMEQGMGLIEATLEGARLRLRPILMTAMTFIIGVLPLALSKGASSGAQNAIGTSMAGGMLSATFLGLLFVPIFFVVVRRLFPVRPEQETSSHVEV
jgi:multidrug efflux pump